MMKYFLVIAVLCSALFAGGQDVSLDLQKEPQMSEADRIAQWQPLTGAVKVSFANSNKRYSRDRVPQLAVNHSTTLTAWKGEKVHTQILLWTGRETRMQVGLTDLRSKSGAILSAENITTGFLDYVWTDEFRNGCGHRKTVDFDSSLVADEINSTDRQRSVNKNEVQPLWVSIDVPAGTEPGSYEGTVTIVADKEYRLKIILNVSGRTLPPSAKWKFNLDLWQHPAAVARVHNVPLWSDAHFSKMKAYYTMLAKAGQKNITASIVNEPWGHQTYDDFPSLIHWTRKRDGSWSFDYSLFDKYIEFVMNTGIDQRINCYSMVPWKVAFQYFDEQLGRDTVFTGKIGSPEYNAFWTPMLKDFTNHLKAKGWFGKTTIAMDERPMAAMQAVIQLLKSIDKDWKIALAGDYHPEIEADIYDYCVASKFKFGNEILDRRAKRGQLSTWYTCCTEKYPNGFTFSPPAEHVWIGWYTAAQNMEGYLRWAYNSWVAAPEKDSRFRTWPAGDTYQVYPGPHTSIRFEKLIEGVQDYEKILILKKEYQQKGQKAKLAALEKALAAFEIGYLKDRSAEEMVTKVKPLLNE